MVIKNIGRINDMRTITASMENGILRYWIPGRTRQFYFFNSGRGRLIMKADLESALILVIVLKNSLSTYSLTLYLYLSIFFLQFSYLFIFLFNIKENNIYILSLSVYKI